MGHLAADQLRFGLAEDIVGMLCAVFSRFPAIEKVSVYGSRANGRFKPRSDIDLAVYAPAMTDSEFARLWNALDDLPVIFKLDVVHVERLSKPALKENIEQHGTVLFARARELGDRPRFPPSGKSGSVP